MEARCPGTVEAALLRHLGKGRVARGREEEGCRGGADGRRCWTVGESRLGGLGLFARRDIERGEVIAVDPPLLTGPRGQDKHLPLCVSCYKRGCALFPCERGCGLPVCSDRCEKSEGHASRECGYLRARRPTCCCPSSCAGPGWSMDLLRLVLPVRALFLDEAQRGLLAFFHRQPLPPESRGSQAKLLASEVRVPPSEEDADLIERVCEVMNATSFESAVLVGEREEGAEGEEEEEEKQSSSSAAAERGLVARRETSSVRALYPVGALQNHSCRPNTRFHVDARQFCHIVASLPIAAGDELTMTYTDLLWDTMLRRKWLYATKRFYCNCLRCADPLEFGTRLGALYCAADHCAGLLFPRQPLDVETSWQCEECALTLNHKQILSIRLNLAKITEEEVSYKTPRQMLRFLQRELPLLVPPTNYITMDIKFRVVSYFGRTEGLSAQSLSDAELETKSGYCRDLLDALDRLGCGDCRKRGLILYELYRSRAEAYRRARGEDSRATPPAGMNGAGEVAGLLRQAVSILRDDVLAANDFDETCPPRI